MSYCRVNVNQRYRWICKIHQKSQMRFHIHNKTTKFNKHEEWNTLQSQQTNLTTHSSLIHLPGLDKNIQILDLRVVTNIQVEVYGSLPAVKHRKSMKRGSNISGRISQHFPVTFSQLAVLSRRKRTEITEDAGIIDLGRPIKRNTSEFSFLRI